MGRHRGDSAARAEHVLITALSDADVMRRASEWRVPVVTKPFPMATLKAAVVEALYPNRS
jgi:hypothetical protein